jgi:hypothetical protein
VSLTDLGKVGLTDVEQAILDLFIKVTSDPNGSVTAVKGALAIDTTNSKIYQNLDGATAWEIKGAGTFLIGLPTDGKYGEPGTGTADAVTGLDQGDSVENAFDKVVTTLAALVPAPAPNLSAVTIVIPNQFTALEQNTGTNRTNVVVETQPVGTTSGVFADGKTGTLDAEIDTIASGQIVLTTGDDSGTNLALTIISDTNFPAPDGFNRALSASIQAQAPLSLANTQHEYKLIHSITGQTSSFFYIDDPQTPGVTAISVVGQHIAPVRRVSGVPSLDVNDDILRTFTVQNAIS